MAERVCSGVDSRHPVSASLYDLWDGRPKDEARFAVIYESFHQASFAEDDDVVCLSYSQLETLVDQIANAVGKPENVNEVIGICVHPSHLLPAVVLAVLKVGAAYCPVDRSQHVKARCQNLPHLNVRRIILQESLMEEFIEAIGFVTGSFMTGMSPLAGDHLPAGLVLIYLEHDVPNAATSGHHLELAYVLHTSGSTGRPKAVKVPHQCIVPNVIDIREKFSIQCDDVVLMCAPYTFDPSVVEMFMTLSRGACLLIVPDEVKAAPKHLADVITRHKVTVIQATPALFNRFDQSYIVNKLLGIGSKLRVVAFGGEQCPTLAKLCHWKHSDNKTRIFNLYGITEVSSWATCYELTNEDLEFFRKRRVLDSKSTVSCNVPLGFPLTDTLLEVRKGKVKISSGEGELWIGGEKRVCLLNDEQVIVNGTMRLSGDIVFICEGKTLYYVGRKDNQVKINGRRVNLENLETTLCELPAIQSCKLLVRSTASRQCSLLVCVVLNSDFRTSKDVVDSSIIKQMAQDCLPSFISLSEVCIVDKLPLTAHGKVDREAMLSLTQSNNQVLVRPARSVLADRSSCQDVDSAVKGNLLLLWKNGIRLSALCQRTDAELKELTFLAAGGTSVAAVELAEQIKQTVFGFEAQDLIEIILHNPFSYLEDYVMKRLLQQSSQFPEQDSKDDKTISSGTDVEFSHLSKVPKMSVLHYLGDSHNCNGMFSAYLRRGSCIQHISMAVDSSQCCDGSEYLSNEITCDMRVSHLWRVDVGKCVDASPLLALGIRSLVFIGSHSYLFTAIDVDTGVVVWQTELPDRIESSAVLSACGEYVAVGCYDGCLYIYHADSGQLYWKFVTGDTVKSSPCTDPYTGYIWFGSHDHYLYAVDLEGKRCISKLHCGGGSCFASPAIDMIMRFLYAATLSGHVVCVDLVKQSIVWTYNCPKSLFSSPCVTQEHNVCIGCVDGFIYCLGMNGKLIWKFNTEGPVFSTPCVLPVSKASISELLQMCQDCNGIHAETCKVILIGSHSHKGYCLCPHGQLLWYCLTNGPIYATPFAFSSRKNSSRSGCTELNPMSCFVSSVGTIFMVRIGDGVILTQYQLPGEVFSSPVIMDGSILLVGCRDNNCYSLSIA